jgi:hypothetical protein
MIRPGNPGRCGESTQANKSSHGAAVCGESRMHGDNGGDGETQVMLCALSLPTDTARLGEEYSHPSGLSLARLVGQDNCTSAKERSREWANGEVIMVANVIGDTRRDSISGRWGS